MYSDDVPLNIIVLQMLSGQTEFTSNEQQIQMYRHIFLFSQFFPRRNASSLILCVIIRSLAERQKGLNISQFWYKYMSVCEFYAISSHPL